MEGAARPADTNLVKRGRMGFASPRSPRSPSQDEETSGPSNPAVVGDLPHSALTRLQPGC